ncbi:MAG: hypothetical protein QGH60_02930 [Phycisphaerae bacterium]|nr:hypothetical protein [Phycisphaerae bacterium]
MLVILGIAELAKRRRKTERWRSRKAPKGGSSESRRASSPQLNATDVEGKTDAPSAEVQAQAAALRAELKGIDLNWTMDGDTLSSRGACEERIAQLGKSCPPIDGRAARKYLSYGFGGFDFLVTGIWFLVFLFRVSGVKQEQHLSILLQMLPFLLGPVILMRVLRMIVRRLSDAARTRQECMECHTITGKAYRARITLGSLDAILRIVKAEAYLLLPNFVRKVKKSPGRMTIAVCPECGSAYVLLDMRVELAWQGRRRSHVVGARWPCAKTFIPAPAAQAVLTRLGIDAAPRTPVREPND